MSLTGALCDLFLYCYAHTDRGLFLLNSKEKLAHTKWTWWPLTSAQILNWLKLGLLSQKFSNSFNRQRPIIS